VVTANRIEHDLGHGSSNCCSTAAATAGRRVARARPTAPKAGSRRPRSPSSVLTPGGTDAGKDSVLPGTSTDRESFTPQLRLRPRVTAAGQARNRAFRGAPAHAAPRRSRSRSAGAESLAQISRCRPAGSACRGSDRRPCKSCADGSSRRSGCNAPAGRGSGSGGRDGGLCSRGSAYASGLPWVSVRAAACAVGAVRERKG